MASLEEQQEQWWAERRKWDEIVGRKLQEMDETDPAFHDWLCEVHAWREALENQDSSSIEK
jgi:hypothetical protein